MIAAAIDTETTGLDPEINELVGAYVEIAGYRCRRALAGEDGLKAARENHPALIVLDVMLPDVDGFEVCRRLKREPNTAGIPLRNAALRGVVSGKGPLVAPEPSPNVP